MTDRQIRFHKGLAFQQFGEIQLEAFASSDGKSTWTPEELIPFGEKFKEVLIARVGTGFDFYILVYES